MRLSRWTALTLTAAFALAIGSVGCKEEGAAEKMGKAVDEAAEDAGDAAEDAKKKMEEAFE
jgi:hypothetical protein